MREDVRLPLSPADARGLARLAADYPRLRVAAAYRSGYNQWLCGVYHDGVGHELIGNKTVAQVRGMVEAIEEGHSV